MIIVKISGGLGNQLFQYSFGRYLSIKFNTELKFDIQTILDYKDFTQRKYRLSDYNIKLNLASEKEISRFKYCNNKYLSRLERKIIQQFPFLNKRYVVQDLYRPYNCINNFNDNCYYDGYWQSEKYFESIKVIIRKDLDFNLQQYSNIKQIFEEIFSSESVSIHIRRCDYINVKANSKLFSVCSIEYYKKGIVFFNSKLNDPQYFVFSDDIEWARNNFTGSQFHFVDPDVGHPEIDLHLMSQCKNNIIANSSFSWWGAWLNSNEKKIVIAPKKWYKGRLNDSISDLIPPEWILI